MDAELLEDVDRIRKENKKLRTIIEKLLGYDMDHHWNMIDHCAAKYNRGPCDCGLEETIRAAEEVIRAGGSAEH